MSTTKVMHTLTSTDGTQIAYQQTGEGPPLVLVHGAISDHSYWDPVRSALEARFSVYAIERRGRGHSGDASRTRSSANTRTSRPSSRRPASRRISSATRTGRCARSRRPCSPRTCARSCSTSRPSIRTAWFLTRIHRTARGVPRGGDRDGVIREMMADVVGLSPEELEQLEASSSWPALVATAHTLPRELRSVDAYRFNPSGSAA